MYAVYSRLKNIVRKFIPRPVFDVLIGWFHLGEAVVANIIYGFPARRMKFVGVTGTNGKTTTTLMVATIFEAAGYKTGLSSTAFVSDGSGVHINNLPGQLTSANPFVLQKLLRKMARGGVEWVALECASQALDQHRVWGIKFEAAIITNLTEDHLDYHGTMANYAAAKGILFRMCRGVGVVNCDDKWADFFLSLGTPRYVTYGRSGGCNFRLKEVELGPRGTKISLDIEGKPLKLNLKLVGEFNAYNAAAALAATCELGVDLAIAKRALEGLERVPGRFDSVEAGQAFAVLIDDAHTPDAMKNVLKAARGVTEGKLFVVSGASGERAVSRRAPLARVASDLADVFIVTDDEPHREDPDRIVKDLLAGTGKGRAEIVKITSRSEAMREAFGRARAGDSVVLAGMGYRNHREGPHGQEPWDERAVAEAILKGEEPPFEQNWRQVMHTAWSTQR